MENTLVSLMNQPFTSLLLCSLSPKMKCKERHLLTHCRGRTQEWSQQRYSCLKSEATWYEEYNEHAHVHTFTQGWRGRPPVPIRMMNLKNVLCVKEQDTTQHRQQLSYKVEKQAKLTAHGCEVRGKGETRNWQSRLSGAWSQAWEQKGCVQPGHTEGFRSQHSVLLSRRQQKVNTGAGLLSTAML